MSELAEAPSPVLPFHDPSRRRRLVKIGGWLGGIAVAIVVLHLLGVDVIGWLRTCGTRSRTSRPATSSRRSSFQTGQTLLAGLSYYGILRAAYPGQVQLWPIVTAYAVGVAMNNFLPANIGTFVTLVMFVAIIPACDVRGVDRRLPRAEDLLHDRGHVRLPLPLPLRAGLVRRESRQHLRAPGRDRS